MGEVRNAGSCWIGRRLGHDMVALLFHEQAHAVIREAQHVPRVGDGLNAHAAAKFLPSEREHKKPRISYEMRGDV
jgi:hypothetical protein